MRYLALPLVVTPDAPINETGNPVYTCSPYERRHRQAVVDLHFFATRNHQQLDWHTPEQWLNAERHVTQLLWKDDKLMAFVSASQPTDGISWLKLLAVDGSVKASELLSALWPSLVQQLRERGCVKLALMMVDDWLTRHIHLLGFAYIEDVVSFNRFRKNNIQLNGNSQSIKIQVAEEEHTKTLYAIDYAAFDPVWRLSYVDIRQAWRIATSATIARISDEIVGYQLSTLNQNYAHLARLAVKPSAQGKGVGKALIHDMINRFQRRGVQSISVNTQDSNRHSQRLYTQFGFERNGYDLPVWIAHIGGDS